MKESIKILKDKTFLKIFLAISIPIIIQNLFSTGLNFISNIMIGKVGSTEAIAAIGVANKLYFLYDLIAFGMISGASIFFAQYFGNKDFKSLKRTIGLTLTLVLSISIIFVLIAYTFPRQVLGLFSKDTVVIDKGIEYLRYAGISYIFTGVTFTLVFVMRAINDTLKPMLSSIVAIVLNIILNYALIYGNFGLPRLEVKGAGIATLIARIVEFSIMFYFVFRKKSIVHSTLKELTSFRLDHVKHFTRIALPVILNEGMWGLGTVAYTLAYSKLGTEALTSTEIGSIVAEMFFVFSFGIGHGAGILIGNSLGANDKEKAKKYGAVFTLLAVFSGVLAGLILFILRGPILNLYNLDPLTMADANKILIINAALLPIRFLNLLFIVGILRGGGDTKYALFIELMGLWVFGVPITFIAVLVFKSPVEIAFFIHFLEELIKTILCLPRYKKGTWLNKVI